MPTRPQHTDALALEAIPDADFLSSVQAVQSFLWSGNLIGVDRAIRAATFHCVSREDDRTLAVLTLRRKLMSGRYKEWEDPEGIWQRTSAKWVADTEIGVLQQALFCSAGWSQTHLNAPVEDFHDTLSALVSGDPIKPEILYPKLAAASQAAEESPELLATFASKPLPKSVFMALGEQVLPPVAEAILAEIWYTHFSDEQYPRIELIAQTSTTEPAFLAVTSLLGFWEELRHHRFQDAARLADTFIVQQNFGLWLRALPLLIHFGSATQIAAIPCCLHKALRLVFHESQVPTSHQPFQQTIQLLAKSLQLWWKEAQQVHPSLAPDEATQQLLAEAGHFPSRDGLPFWSGQTGSSLAISQTLSECAASPLDDTLIEQLSLPALARAHAFTHALFLAHSPQAAGTEEETEKVIRSWLDLPTAFRTEPAYHKALLDYLGETGKPLEPSVMLLLADAGLAVSTLLSDQERVELFIARPTQEHLKHVSDIPQGGLAKSWLLLLEAALPLDRSSYSSAEELLKRLASGPDLPPPEEAQDTDSLKRIALLLKEAVCDQLTLRLALRVALRAGYMGLHDAAMELLAQSSLTDPGLSASVSARLWLRTGRSQFFAPDRWASLKDSWASTALGWHQLSTSAEVSALPEYPKNTSVPAPLREAFMELRAWVIAIQNGSVLRSFEYQNALRPLAEDWAFLKPFISEESVADITQAVAPRLLTALLQAANCSISEPDGLRGAHAVLVSYATGVARAEYAAVTLAKAAADCPSCYDILLSQCVGVLSSRFTWKLRRALLANGQGNRVKALELENHPSLSAAAKKALSYPLNETNERAIRLTMLKVVGEDLYSLPIWQMIADFLHSELFSPCSKAQWEMISALREKVGVLDQASLRDMLLVLEEEDATIIDRMFFLPLKPALVDVSNLIYDAAVEPYVEDPFDFLESVWSTLAVARYYPILSYIDKPKIRDFSAEIRQHLNRLTKETKIAPTTGQAGDASQADYHILIEAGGRLKQHTPLIITNDYFAKPYRLEARRGEPNGWSGHPEFLWLNEALFDSMRARFTQGASVNTWEIVTPDNQKLAVYNTHHF